MRVTLLPLLFFLGACQADNAAPALGGDPESGRLLLHQFGCGSCHEIPRVAAARGKVGPPLGGIASRFYIAGVLANTPENMVAFIRVPEIASPRTAMPNLGVSHENARDMVAYLYTLK